MRHAAGELPDRLELLRFEELCKRGLALADGALDFTCELLGQPRLTVDVEHRAHGAEQCAVRAAQCRSDSSDPHIAPIAPPVKHFELGALGFAGEDARERILASFYPSSIGMKAYILAVSVDVGRVKKRMAHNLDNACIGMRDLACRIAKNQADGRWRFAPLGRDVYRHRRAAAGTAGANRKRGALPRGFRAGRHRGRARIARRSVSPGQRSLLHDSGSRARRPCRRKLAGIHPC